jgi:threonyl-tRNA synthetase
MSKIKNELKNDPLMPLRHTAEHILHRAVAELYPESKKVMGPPIEDGFYFDFDLEQKITPEDFPKIERQMRNIIDSGLPVCRKEVSAEEAKEMFKDNPYKLECIAEIEARNEKVSLYEIGQPGDKHYDVDLCAGPHVENTGEVKAFKLLNIAGAYWKGDEKNKMLQRIYATAFDSEKALEEHLEKLEDAKRRDHKKLGKELDLFFMDEDIGKGLPMWTPNGTAIKYELEKFTRDLERRYGYQHVETPYLAKDSIYKISGHLAHYKQNMYAPIDMDGELFYLRPMACPHHIKIFQHKQRSYREFPIRYAEIADYNRFEKSGELMGLIRVRKFQLTDAHIFVTPEGIKDEFMKVVSLIQEGMRGLGLIDSVRYRFSKHDPADKEKYYPDPELWAKAESLMQEALDEQKLDYYEAVGEAAFYGPKLDIQMVNVNGKEDTAFTAQMDFLLPEKFGLEYISEDGSTKRPVMIHRSAIGALERVMAFIIEHFAGAFPVWLAPTQVAVIPIGEKHNDYAYELSKALFDMELRTVVMDKNDTMQSKIREAQGQKIPYMLVVGDKEIAAKTVSVRFRTGESMNGISFEEFKAKIKEIYLTRSLKLW